MTLRDYQSESIKNIVKAFHEHKRVMYQLSTGGGKTFIFSYLTKILEERGKRVLILVDRKELIEQTLTSLLKLGVNAESLTANKRKLKHFSNVYVGMVETAYNRLKKDNKFFRKIDLLIIDEAHMMSYNKVFPYFENSKILGVTATPVVLKRETFYKCGVCRSEYKELTECCGDEVMEWTRPFSLSNIYDTIVCGPGIHELIEREKLVKEISIVKKSVDTSKLKTDKTGEFTEQSMTHAFNAPDSLQALLKDYESTCKGKKTMIFTGSTKVNAELEKLFSGYNAKIFDTKNSKENRKDVVNWYKNSTDGILISTGIFTKGFDCTDVEVIIMYRATKSLALFIQIVGRGARIHPGKFNFVLIDYGDNINTHNEFSDSTRDWERIFYSGVGKPKPKIERMEDVAQCEECGALYPKSEDVCLHCGAEPKPKKKKEQRGKEYVLKPITPMPPPSGKKIIAYTKMRGEGVSFAFKVLTNQIIDLFRFYSVTEEQYYKAKKSGELDRKIDNIIRKAYFEIIKSDLNGANRRLSTIIEKIKSKIEKKLCSPFTKIKSQRPRKQFQ